LRWAVNRFRGRNGCTKFINVGDPVGSVNKKGYYVVHVKGFGYLYVHRIIWEISVGPILENCQLDHLNGMRDDNRLNNLRVVSSAQNSRNRKIRSDNTSGVAGVARRTFKSRTLGSPDYVSYVFQGSGLDGGRIVKSFSVRKYGEEKAFLMACIYRDFIILEMNDLNAGYTTRHLGAEDDIDW
jgi:hypothetical protein